MQFINAFLMSQPRDVDSLPLIRRVFLSVLFATCLWLHLSYFFWAMCIAHVVLLGDTPLAWPAPFNQPFAASSPSELWNRRWHTMFRWHFVRLVYKPTRAALAALLGEKASRSKAAKVRTCVHAFVSCCNMRQEASWRGRDCMQARKRPVPPSVASQRYLMLAGATLP